MTVRTRVAPSPTGDPHVGTAYIALLNLCFAKTCGGKFVLRIEDTDQSRSTDESEAIILEALQWLGLQWDEGPDVGGDFGPYRQSERKAIYQAHVQLLLDKGHAFKCYRTPEELDSIRNDFREQGISRAIKPSDLALPADEQARREQVGAPYVVRMMVPETDDVCAIDDMLRGTIELPWTQVDAQILLKSDGMPTYHLANVVDDHLMQISHVLRGEEWINSAPKHKLLYQYFGWDMPQLCHLPLLRNPDKSKLSKRKNPTSILYYQRMGYLPEALLNYLGRMGWSMPDEREKFSLADMLVEFDINRVSLGGPVFDVEKLKWLNGVWIREELDDEQLTAKLVEWAFNEQRLKAFLPHARARMELLSDVAPLGSFLVSGDLAIDANSFDSCNMDEEQLLRVLQFTLWRLEQLHPWQREFIFSEIKTISDSLGEKLKSFLEPIFIAISGTTASISVMDAMVLLGPDMTRARLRFAINTLGGLGKKRLKKLEKEYQALV